MRSTEAGDEEADIDQRRSGFKRRQRGATDSYDPRIGGDLDAHRRLGCERQDATPTTGGDHSDIEIAYVLHGLNAFTERIKTGAEDAARDYGVKLQVFGDASFDTQVHQGFFFPHWRVASMGSRSSHCPATSGSPRSSKRSTKASRSSARM